LNGPAASSYGGGGGEGGGVGASSRRNLFTADAELERRGNWRSEAGQAELIVRKVTSLRTVRTESDVIDGEQQLRQQQRLHHRSEEETVVIGEKQRLIIQDRHLDGLGGNWYQGRHNRSADEAKMTSTLSEEMEQDGFRTPEQKKLSDLDWR
jgi:hypothetical protein